MNTYQFSTITKTVEKQFYDYDSLQYVSIKAVSYSLGELKTVKEAGYFQPAIDRFLAEGRERIFSFYHSEEENVFVCDYFIVTKKSIKQVRKMLHQMIKRGEKNLNSK